MNNSIKLITPMKLTDQKMILFSLWHCSHD